MKSIKTLLKENNLKDPSDYYDLILKEYQHGRHLKAAYLFQELKKDQKEFFLCRYLNPEVFKNVIVFFIKELLI